MHDGRDLPFICERCLVVVASPIPESHVATDADETNSEHSFIVNEDVPDTAAIEESDIDNLDADVFVMDGDDGPSFTIVRGRTKKDKDKLVDRSGYTYNVKKRYVHKWFCNHHVLSKILKHFINHARNKKTMPIVK